MRSSPASSARRSATSSTSRRLATPGIGVRGAVVRQPVGEACAQRSEERVALERPGQVDEERRGDLQVAGVGPGPHDPETGSCGAPLDRTQQPGLAEAGLAGDQEEVALARADLVEPAVGQREQVVTTDQDRTDQGPEVLLHGAKLGEPSDRSSGR